MPPGACLDIMKRRFAAMGLEKLIDALSDMEVVDLGQTLEDHMPLDRIHARFY